MEAVSDEPSLELSVESNEVPQLVWIDVDNPAQVQYLLRFHAALARLGSNVLLTARASGMTTRMLDGVGFRANIVGGDLGRGKLTKGAGTLRRAFELWALCRGSRRPNIALSTSRAAAIASRWLGVNHFVLLDYEHVDLSVYRQAGCWILHPEVIPAAAFTAHGIPEGKLIPFRGLKEDITFSTMDPQRLRPPNDRKPVKRVLVRPPLENSHYYVHGSTAVTNEVLDLLSTRPDVQVHFSPRHLSQKRYLTERQWAVPPVFYDRPVDFLQLLSGCDAVVSAGGTMLREAAYIGMPAFSTFQGKVGAVDLHLESEQRLVFVRSAGDVERGLQSGLNRKPPMTPRSGLVNELINAMVSRVPEARFSRLRRRSVS